MSALLQAVLACPHLAGGWSDYYGISSAKCNALTAPSTRKAGYSADSFDNPNSETALSLFLLGNVDGWKQLNAIVETPRVGGVSWNPKFFELLTAPTPIAPFPGQPRWSDGALSAPLFESDEVDFERLILLFEVEAGGKVFRQATDEGQEDIRLSFLNLAGLKKWVRFDAVLIDPTHRRFYLAEAKLGYDLSLDMEKYTLVNQAVRGLEAGYWLTHDAASKYRGWEFRFVLLCPRPLWEYRLRLYAHVLRSPDTVTAMLGDYRRLLTERYPAAMRLTGAQFDAEFDQFVRVASNAVRVVHWDTLAAAVAPAGSAFWSGYFRQVEAAYRGARLPEETSRAVKAVRDRLRTACVEVSD